MAAEYSRELGVKVYEGKKPLVLLGFRAGAVPGYGLRRMLILAGGKRKQRLKAAFQSRQKEISTSGTHAGPVGKALPGIALPVESPE